MGFGAITGRCAKGGILLWSGRGTQEDREQAYRSGRHKSSLCSKQQVVDDREVNRGEGSPYQTKLKASLLGNRQGCGACLPREQGSKANLSQTSCRHPRSSQTAPTRGCKTQALSNWKKGREEEQLPQHPTCGGVGHRVDGGRRSYPMPRHTRCLPLEGNHLPEATDEETIVRRQGTCLPVSAR